MRAIPWVWAALLIGVFSGQTLAWQPAQPTQYDATDYPMCSAPIESPGGLCLREAECRCESH